MSKTIEEAAKKAITDNDFFMADPNHPEFVDRGLEQMRACKWVINHIFSLPLASRLTEAEKERIRTTYKAASEGYYTESDDINCAVEMLLDDIFGKEMFNENESV